MRVGGRTWIGLAAVICLAGWAAAYANWFGTTAGLTFLPDPAVQLIAAALTIGTIAGIAITALLAEHLGTFRTLVSGMLLAVAASWLPIAIPAQPFLAPVAALMIGVGLAPAAKTLLLGFCAPTIPRIWLATAACMVWAAATAPTLMFIDLIAELGGMKLASNNAAGLFAVGASGLVLAAATGWALRRPRADLHRASSETSFPWRPALVVALIWIALRRETSSVDILASIYPGPNRWVIAWVATMLLAAAVGVLSDRYGSRRTLRWLLGPMLVLLIAFAVLDSSLPSWAIQAILVAWEITKFAGAPIAIAYLISQLPQSDIRRFGIIWAGVFLAGWLIDLGTSLLQSGFVADWLPVAAAFAGWLVLRPQEERSLAESRVIT